MVSWLAALGSNIPVIASEHNAFERPSYAALSIKDRIVKFFAYRFFWCVTVLSNADKHFVNNSLDNVFVMPNPLPLRPVHLLPPARTKILAVGRLDDWHCKGFDVLIRAWALVNGKLKIDNGQLSSKGESWKLQIAGTGSEKSLNYLKQLCKENEVEDSVEFLGFRKDVEKLYQDASIFVLSSRYEGFGLVLIEAMSQGCACVACDYKGRQREILNPAQDKSLETRNLNLETRNRKFETCDTGILCEPDNVESLAAGIQKMIDDDEYRESVRKNVIERSKYYSIENTMDRWESLLKQVIDTR